MLSHAYKNMKKIAGHFRGSKCGFVDAWIDTATWILHERLLYQMYVSIMGQIAMMIIHIMLLAITDVDSEIDLRDK